MDWESLQSIVVHGNTQEFLNQVTESLQTGNKQFGVLQKGLREQCFQQVPINAARDFVCQALLRLISDENTEGKTPIAHLLLEAVPPDNGVPRTSDKAAAHLFSVCCCAERARLAVKVAQVFSVKLTDVEDQQQCRRCVHSLLQDKALLTPAVGLLLHFPQLSDGISVSEVLEGLVEEGQLGLAQRWAATLPLEVQIRLVTHCVACDRLKEAVKLVRHFHLQQVWRSFIIFRTDCYHPPKGLCNMVAGFEQPRCMQ
ncbi:hypothetical protein ABBQ32_001183 [Trebouxia sp. C0010 RCD-2024]